MVNYGWEINVMNHLRLVTAFEDLDTGKPVSYTHLRAHETVLDLVCRLLLEKKNDSISSTLLTFLTHNLQLYITSVITQHLR